MHYLDSSVIAAIVLSDPESDRVERNLRALHPQPLCLSLWTGVEVFSAIARRLRMHEISARDAARSRKLYDEEFVSQYTMHGVSVPDFDRARGFLALDGTPLRSGDALHLAIAMNRGVTSFHTLDKVLRKIANQVGLHAPPV